MQASTPHTHSVGLSPLHNDLIPSCFGTFTNASWNQIKTITEGGRKLQENPNSNLFLLEAICIGWVFIIAPVVLLLISH